MSSIDPRKHPYSVSQTPYDGRIRQPPDVKRPRTKTRDVFQRGESPPPDYQSALREINHARLTELRDFDKRLKKKSGAKGAKGAAGGTILGGGIFGGLVGHMVSHSAVTGGVFAKAGAVLVASHFWPVLVLGACIAIGAGVGLAIKQNKLTHLARQDLRLEREQIKHLRNGLIQKQKDFGLTPEEREVVRVCSRILGRFHLNPLRALGEILVGVATAAPIAFVLGLALFALEGGTSDLNMGGPSGGGSSGSGSGLGGGGGGSSINAVNTVAFWDPDPFGYYYGGPDFDSRWGRDRDPNKNMPRPLNTIPPVQHPNSAAQGVSPQTFGQDNLDGRRAGFGPPPDTFW